jgi:L,D-transpeptidase ErfK/SrfK
MLARVCLFLAVLLTSAAPVAAAEPPVLYHQVVGGEEDYVVKKGDTLGILAARQGMRWQTLARLNGIKPQDVRLKPGTVLKINKTHIVPQELVNGLIINLPELTLYHFDHGVFKRRYTLAVGKSTWQTPLGSYDIVSKAKNPTWLVPASIQEEMEEMGREVITRVPPGPENPLGAYWMATSASGVGIHATNRPWSVGHFVSHGCIRMLPEEIAELFPQVEVGAPVKIIYRAVKLAAVPDGRIFLEVHPDIYYRRPDNMALVQEIARLLNLAARIDWPRVAAVLKAKEGFAVDITLKTPPPPTSATLPQSAPAQESRLIPLQDRAARVK